VPGAAERFATELRTADEIARRAIVEIDCAPGQRPHRLEPSSEPGGDRRYRTLDHDEAAERVVAAVGGEPPPCLVVVDALPDVSGPRLWAVLLAQHGRPAPPAPDALLTRLPPALVRHLLARRLAEEFAGSGSAVHESVAKLGLALLAPGFELTPQDVDKYQRTRSFPRWDAGARAWRDAELVQLDRWFHAAPGDRLPHLAHLPTDPMGRRVIAQFVADTLDDHHLYTRTELAAALSPIFHNVSRLVRLLLDQRLLEESNGCFRTVDTAASTGRRRGRRSA
jgi:hypothetical protein